MLEEPTSYFPLIYQRVAGSSLPQFANFWFPLAARCTMKFLSLMLRRLVRAPLQYFLVAGVACLLFSNVTLGQTSAHPSGLSVTKPLSFNQTIEPILSESCYACHGPDPGARKAKQRLDRAEFAYAPHDKTGPAILPGRPEISPLVQIIVA